jgi:hypothetical protein
MSTSIFFSSLRCCRLLEKVWTGALRRIGDTCPYRTNLVREGVYVCLRLDIAVAGDTDRLGS